MYQFAKKHADQLKIAQAQSLEDKRGQATNPCNNGNFFKILEDVKTKCSIKPENIYGSDEVGIQPLVLNAKPFHISSILKHTRSLP